LHTGVHLPQASHAFRSMLNAVALNLMALWGQTTEHRLQWMHLAG